MRNIHRIIGTAVVVLGLAAGSGSGDDAAPRSSLRAPDPSRPWFAGASGAYTTPEGQIQIDVRKAGVAEIRSARWEAVGFFDGARFTGLVRPLDGTGEPVADAEFGSLRFTYRDGIIDAVLGVVMKDKPLEQRWTRTNVPEVRTRRGPTDGPPQRAPSGDDPAFREYVFVDELPEAITKVPPSYPEAAREKRVQGLVIVQALVARTAA